MTLSEAAAIGMSRVRLPVWADPQAYLKMTLPPRGGRGVWVELFERKTQEYTGEPTPQKILCVEDDEGGFVEYVGKRDPKDA